METVSDDGEIGPIQRVSEKDRDYFRRLGEWEAENERQDLARHLARSLDERLAFSWRATVTHGRFLRPGADDDGELYARARRLGLLIR
jgi:hypothetical protein